MDPVADKLLVSCATLALGWIVSQIAAHFLARQTTYTVIPFPFIKLSLQGVLHPALVALIVIRDAGLVAGSFVYRARTR